ncbi:MAG: ABC transporter transmembrane domain-containing protein, partial [Flavobacteriales bacterium]
PGPLRPMFVGHMVDKYMIKSQDPNMLLWWTLVILGLLIAEAFLRFLSSYFSNLFAQSIIRDVRKQLMKHILTFRIKYFDKTPVGTLITRIVSDLEAITEVFSSGMIVVAGEILTLIFSIALMFYTNWELALLVLIPIPILLLATRIFARLMRKSFQLEAKQVTKLNVFVQERITGMSLVQLFNRQEKEY